MLKSNNQKIGAILAISGAICLFIGTLWHPLSADPNDPLAAFNEYAANAPWVASHLMQLLGVLLMVVALALLTRLLNNGGGADWAAVGQVCAGAGLAIAAALQAVDGVALKVMVDSWAVASAADKPMLFYATFGVRQVEVGLASMLSLMLGITVAIYGVALVLDKRFPKWLGWLAVVGGLPTAASGVIMAYTGFSELAMDINMPTSALLLVWMMVVGLYMWRLVNLTGLDAGANLTVQPHLQFSTDADSKQ